MRHGRLTLLAHAVAVALLLLAVPASSEVFAGTAKVTAVCHGVPATKFVVPITVDILPGQGIALISTPGYSLAVFADWILDGNRSYFAASYADPQVGTYTYAGTIKGTRLKGYLTEHYFSGCSITGKLAAKQ